MSKKKGLMPVLDAECDSNVQEEGFNARFGCCMSMEKDNKGFIIGHLMSIDVSEIIKMSVIK
jgi:hypothetical protein